MNFPWEKTFNKLWDTLVTGGVGSLLRPWQTKRDGMAQLHNRAAELLVLAQAERDAKDIRAGKKDLQVSGTRLLLTDSAAEPGRSQSELLEQVDAPLLLNAIDKRIKANLIADEVRREVNIARAVIQAEDAIVKDPGEPTPDPVNEDWLLVWKEHAGRVSEEHLQRLWGNVLAGEIKTPGTFSLRTMEALKSFSKKEAEQISDAARFVIGNAIIRVPGALLKQNGLNLTAMLRLQDLGLIQGVEAKDLKSRYQSTRKDKFFKSIRVASKEICIEHEDPERVLALPAYMVTPLGREIVALIKPAPNDQYLASIVQHISKLGFSAVLKDGDSL